MEEPGGRIYDIPEEPPPRAAPQAAAPPAQALAAETPGRTVDGGWWRTLAENCKGRLPPMYRPFLGMCSGFLEGDLLTVCAPDDLTLGRLDNDRVRDVLAQEAEALTGGPVRLAFQAGEPPKSSPEENLKNLVAFGRQFDNIEIK
jgi:DNA polymerase-3 subunit gamma/tau